MKVSLSRLVRAHGSRSEVVQWLLLLSLGVFIQVWITCFRLHKLPQKAIGFSEEFPISIRTKSVPISPVAFLSRLAKPKPARFPVATMSAAVERPDSSVGLAELVRRSNHRGGALRPSARHRLGRL